MLRREPRRPSAARQSVGTRPYSAARAIAPDATKSELSGARRMTAHIDPPRKAVNADQDTVETADWLASLGSLHRSAGAERVRYILAALDRRAKELGVLPDSPPFSPYRNSIPLEQQKP